MDEYGDNEDMRTLLERRTTCSICGQRKTHYRLYGYRCSNPEHARMEAEQELPEVLNVGKRKFKRMTKGDSNA